MCYQTFELLTGHWLFDPENGGSIEDDHLAKMMELTGEVFTAETLQYARRREHFFDREGKSTKTLHPFRSHLC